MSLNQINYNSTFETKEKEILPPKKTLQLETKEKVPTEVEQTYGILDLISGDFGSKYCQQYIKRKKKNYLEYSNIYTEGALRDLGLKSSIYELRKLGGSPKIIYSTNDGSIAYPIEKNSHYDHISDIIHLVDRNDILKLNEPNLTKHSEELLEQFIQEMAHSFQDISWDLINLFFKDYYKTKLPKILGGYGLGVSQQDMYEISGSLEHDAHSVRAPKLALQLLLLYNKNTDKHQFNTSKKLYDLINKFYGFNQKSNDLFILIESIELGNIQGYMRLICKLVENNNLPIAELDHFVGRNYNTYLNKVRNSGGKYYVEYTDINLMMHSSFGLNSERVKYLSKENIVTILHYVKIYEDKDWIGKLLPEDLALLKIVLKQSLQDRK